RDQDATLAKPSSITYSPPPASADADPGEEEEDVDGVKPFTLLQTILVGQICSLMLSGTNITADSLFQDKVELPVFLNLLNYLLLFVVYGSFYLWKSHKMAPVTRPPDVGAVRSGGHVDAEQGSTTPTRTTPLLHPRQDHADVEDSTRIPLLDKHNDINGGEVDVVEILGPAIAEANCSTSSAAAADHCCTQICCSKGGDAAKSSKE
ncbi:unnamed protein product, partial [Amoebophrya sp. A25]